VSDLLSGLDAPCPICERVCGDHTLREWAACTETLAVDLPYEAVPSDIADAVRQRFQLGSDVVVADHCVIKAVALEGAAGYTTIRVPAVLHEFAIGQMGTAPTTVAKVLYLASPDGLRAYGRLVRDSANGAANGKGRVA